MEDIPADIQNFIRTPIASVDTLRVLLLLRSDPQRGWTSINVSAKLYLDPNLAEKLLHGLTDTGFLKVTTEQDPTYRYAPKDTELAGMVDCLAQFDKERPVTLLNLIYASSKGPVQALTDAFKLRKE